MFMTVIIARTCLCRVARRPYSTVTDITHIIMVALCNRADHYIFAL